MAQIEESVPSVQNNTDPLIEAWEQADFKAEELTQKYKRKILPVIVTGESANDLVVGYMYERDGLTDVKLAAAKISGPDISFPRAVQAIESLMLFEESDDRFREFKYVNGAALYLLSLVEIGQPQLKKK